MFERFNGNVVPFADESTSTNRTVFGSETQSDDIDDNLNSDFKKGWEIVGLNDNPTREDFNAMGYTLGYLTSYLYQNGVAEYNLLQEYKTNSIAIGTDGNIYQSLVDNNIGNILTDTTKWVCIASKNSIVNSIAELKTISNVESINVLGYYEKGDGGGGTFYWDSTSTETDNGGTIIQATGITTGRWKRVYSGSVNVKWFGAKNSLIVGNETFDSTIAIQKAINVSSKVYAPSGRYNVDKLYANNDGTYIYGDGMLNTIFFALDIYPFATHPEVNALITVNDMYYSTGTRKADIKLSDITLSGRNGATLSDRDLLAIYGAGYEFILTNVHFDGVQRRAIYAKDLWDSTINGCKFTWCGLSNVNHHAVLLDTADSFGINSNAIKFTNCHFEANSTGDIWLRNGANQITIIGNKFEASSSNVNYNCNPVIQIDDTCSHVNFSANTCVMFQRDKTVPFIYAGASGTNIIGNLFITAHDKSGNYAIQTKTMSNLLATNIIGNTFFLDGGNGIYPLNIDAYCNISNNVINVVNPRKVISIGSNCSFNNNKIIGKGIINQTGDILCNFTGDNSDCINNTLININSSNSGNIHINQYSAIKSNSNIPITNGFDPNQYSDNDTFITSDTISTIVGSTNGRSVNILIVGGTVVSGSGMWLNGNFTAGFGMIKLQFVAGYGWFEISRKLVY